MKATDKLLPVDIERMAEQFGEIIPEKEFSPAQIQGKVSSIMRMK